MYGLSCASEDYLSIIQFHKSPPRTIFVISFYHIFLAIGPKISLIIIIEPRSRLIQEEWLGAQSTCDVWLWFSGQMSCHRWGIGGSAASSVHHGHGGTNGRILRTACHTLNTKRSPESKQGQHIITTVLFTVLTGRYSSIYAPLKVNKDNISSPLSCLLS